MTERHSARKEEILDAAEICFARQGFHQTSINDICAELGMSPGNLYHYFRSKEELIESIVERNLAASAEVFRKGQEAEDIASGLSSIAEHYLLTGENKARVDLWIEIMAEARRNPVISEIYHKINNHVSVQLSSFVQTAAEANMIRKDLDLDAAVRLLGCLGDGLCLRRAIDPSFALEPLLPTLTLLLRRFLTEIESNDN